VKLIDTIRRYLGNMYFDYADCKSILMNEISRLGQVAAEQASLLHSAPMINMEKDYFARASTKYAYIHPTTFHTMAPPGMVTSRMRRYGVLDPIGEYGFNNADKPTTKWIFTRHMPEGQVIFSQKPLLGWEPE